MVTVSSHFLLTFVSRDLISVERKDGSCAESSASLTINTTDRISLCLRSRRQYTSSCSKRWNSSLLLLYLLVTSLPLCLVAGDRGAAQNCDWAAMLGNATDADYSDCSIGSSRGRWRIITRDALSRLVSQCIRASLYMLWTAIAVGDVNRLIPRKWLLKRIRRSEQLTFTVNLWHCVQRCVHIP